MACVPAGTAYFSFLLLGEYFISPLPLPQHGLKHRTHPVVGEVLVAGPWKIIVVSRARRQSRGLRIWQTKGIHMSVHKRGVKVVVVISERFSKFVSWDWDERILVGRLPVQFSAVLTLKNMKSIVMLNECGKN